MQYFVNGAKYAVSTTLGAAVAISAITNDDPAVATAAVLPAEGDVVLLDSNWTDLAEQATYAILREVEEYGAYLSGELYDVSIENMLSGEPLMEEYSMTREAAEQAVTEFFSNRGAQ